MKAMKALQKILFTMVAVIGLSMAVFAQKDGDKKPPPKGTPPVVTPQPKPPPPDPKKKPGGEAWIIWNGESDKTA